MGNIHASQGAKGLGAILHRYIRRHYSGDWEEEIHENQKALESGEAILSQYEVVDGSGVAQILLIMTEADRTYTIIHLLDELLDEPGGE